LVLPSPNGSAIAAAAGGRVTVAASLRNARAVAAWMTRCQDGPFAVVAAGERWPDGSLRPALEDLLGAGAVLAARSELAPLAESPEAAAARAAYETSDSIPDDVRTSVSGAELVTSGFSQDVDVAVEIDTSDGVPILRGEAFQSE
jgi:2-phosphosulfolactate phosphatase